jgi:beta-ribofuranosylaminobenzene 5'-phosphate synthase
MDDRRASVQVTTGARLHFGLLDTCAPFGGVGVMIDEPVTCVEVCSSARFHPGQVQPERLTAIAGRLAKQYLGAQNDEALPPCTIGVESSAPSHSGLGSGTQLALATATALASHFDLQLSRDQLVALAERGKRSAIGSIGFFEGGLIAESDPVAKWQRAELPAKWRVVLARPRHFDHCVSGELEGNVFASLPPASDETRQHLIRLADEILLAAQQADFDSFAAALTAYNRLSGELFTAQQGGCYNGPAVAELVEQLQGAGARAYGQSSWGPTVFVFCASPKCASNLADRIGDCVFAITTPRTAGASVRVQRHR